MVRSSNKKKRNAALRAGALSDANSSITKEPLTQLSGNEQVVGPVNNPMKGQKEGSSSTGKSSNVSTVKMKATTVSKTPVRSTNAQQNEPSNQPIQVDNPDIKLFHTCIDDNGNEYLVTLCGLTCGGFLYPQGKRIDPKVAHDFVSNRIRKTDEDDLSDVTTDSKKGGESVAEKRGKKVDKKKVTNTVVRDLSYQSSMTNEKQTEYESEQALIRSYFNKYFKKSKTEMHMAEIKAKKKIRFGGQVLTAGAAILMDNALAWAEQKAREELLVQKEEYEKYKLDKGAPYMPPHLRTPLNNQSQAPLQPVFPQQKLNNQTFARPPAQHTKDNTNERLITAGEKAKDKDVPSKSSEENSRSNKSRGSRRSKKKNTNSNGTPNRNNNVGAGGNGGPPGDPDNDGSTQNDSVDKKDLEATSGDPDNPGQKMPSPIVIYTVTNSVTDCR